jgi:hypothetical protein
MLRLLVTANKLNKRKLIPASLPDANSIVGVVYKNFEFTAEEVPTASVPNPSLGKWYKDTDNYFYWGGGVIVVQQLPSATPAPGAKAQLAAPQIIPHDMPLSQLNCKKIVAWMKQNFENKVIQAVENTPFEKEVIYAIACQETAQRWLLWIDSYDAATVLQRCVFDASGDFPDTSRSAFPKNKNELLAEFGADITQMLIDEGNKMRAMPQPGHPQGYGAASFLYKGYGIFQYDLQFIKEDKNFFVDKLWYSIDECLSRAIKELKSKWSKHPNDLFHTVKAYNGGGDRAEQYALRVSQFYTWIKAM